MRILAASDIHLGRRPSHGLSGQQSWDLVVDKACELGVDVLLLAGDVIEHERAWLSVYAPLIDGLKRLAEAKIRTIAVSGNHDFDVFSRLAVEGEAITILGQGGRWEHVDFQGVRFIGWSFSQSHHEQNPFDTFDRALSDGTLTLGLLHTEVGFPASRYAPSRTFDFTCSGVGLWVLGHIHRPQMVVDGQVLYCGSPLALDSSERGEHGVWLIETQSALAFEAPRFIPLSPIRYEEVAVDVTGLDEAEAVRAQIRANGRTGADGLCYGTTLYLTIRFVGTKGAALDLAQVMGQIDEAVPFPAKEGVACSILPSYIDATTPAIDLDSLAQGEGVDAQLARLIRDPVGLLELYRRLEKESFNASAYSALQERSIDEETALREATGAALRFLSAMALQREGGV